MKKIVYILFFIFIQPETSNAQAPSLSFGTPILVSGTANSLGAVYKYTNVISGVDAFVTILSRTGTAAQIGVNTFDAAPGAGYINAFQPVMDLKFPFLQNDRIGMVFKFDFKTTGGAVYTFPTLAMTIIDCDGTNSGSNNFRETVAANNVYSYNVLSPSITFSTDSFFNVTSSSTDFSGIDSSNTTAMCQLNYTNTSSIKIKCGAYGTSSSSTLARQYCFYFKPFLSLVTLLPVTLLNFNVIKKSQNDRTINISWQTASETNSDYFEIERMHENDSQFTPIGKIKSAGNSSVIHSYSCIDANCNNDGIFYYRLKQVDFNGAYTYSPIRSISQTSTINELIAVAPNPIIDKLILDYSILLKKGTVRVSLINAAGQNAWMTEDDHDGKATVKSFYINNIARGYYTLIVCHSNYTETIRTKVFVE